MSSPLSTYRVQLSPAFKLSDLEQIVNYLERLQIATVYAAPFFQAKEGSTHGYDVSDPFVINKEIGDLEGFRSISETLKRKGMAWLQDIVPNHMANHPTNPWLHSVLELGAGSPYYRHFDIDWNNKNWTGKVMVPILGAPEEEVLKKGVIELQHSSNGLSICYYENEYPVSAGSYSFILNLQKDTFRLWLSTFNSMGHGEDPWHRHKEAFFKAIEEDAVLSHAFHAVIEAINTSENLMQQLLERQHYKLVHWKESEKKINFRRFFTINDLICLRMEDEKVFEDYHRFILELCEEGLITGLRIDHIDGLFDPVGYLERLRGKVGEDQYIIIEKILEWEEQLPTDWPMQGTSGYEFLAVVNNLFTAAKNKAIFQQHYQEIFPHHDYEDLVYEKKQFILYNRMGGELQNLVDLLAGLGVGGETDELKEALGTFLAAFPIYRIYAKSYPLSDWDQSIVVTAYEKAVRKAPHLTGLLSKLRDLYLGQTETEQDKALFFLQRCQQFTGPLAAKGVEDTLFYNYNLLISHNEVGDSPHVFGLSTAEFHRRMAERQASFPYALSASATHDTKRGEDARMRINVLSEIPGEWFEKVKQWRALNQSIRRSAQVPDANEEYFIYQMLLGAMAFEDEDEEELLQRTLAYLQKVLREAKVHTFWSEPDEEYEKEVADFVTNVLQHEAFRRDFEPFKSKIARYGAFYSLGQTLVKVTAPGVPDIYQGTELWDLSYVDPDNRRPVDYRLREQYLSEIEAMPSTVDALAPMQQDFTDGRIKMFTLYKALRERKAHPLVFEQGEYIPVALSDGAEDQVVAYLRRYKGQCYLIAVPLGITDLALEEGLSLDIKAFGEGYLKLPLATDASWTHVYTGEVFQADDKLLLGDVFAFFPVAFLKTNIA